eukprot:Tamp_27324.p1 GENE.Tamp_27324~~Tamp_27324.p1  ORF type:complete len:237 (+),score=26.57 Tamp_27324:27-713(+)
MSGHDHAFDAPAAPAAPHRVPPAGYAAAAVRGSSSPIPHRPAPHPQLSRFECANAARNCAEYFGEQQAREWLEHRNLALSEMCLKVTPLLKSLLFESLPLWMSWPLCASVEGPLAASNRGLNFFHGCTLAKLPARVLQFVLILALFDFQGLTYYLIVYWMFFFRDLPLSAPFEIFGMIFLGSRRPVSSRQNTASNPITSCPRARTTASSARATRRRNSKPAGKWPPTS